MSHLSELPEKPVVGVAMPHESATLHVTGTALYTDDLVYRTKDVLHAYPVQVMKAHGKITALRTEPALAVPGVVRVLTGADVPGVNDAGMKHDEPLFPDEVMFHGHAVAWVLGETLEAARLGAAAVEVELDALPALVTVAEAIAAESFHGAQPPDGDRRHRRRVRGVRARLHRRVHLLRPGALLPGDARRARPGRRERAAVHPEQHPAPLGDPGDRLPRPGRPRPRDDRAVPAHGRRIRRQGDAAARVRGHRRARRQAHRPPGPACASTGRRTSPCPASGTASTPRGGSGSTTKAASRPSTPP